VDVETFLSDSCCQNVTISLLFTPYALQTILTTTTLFGLLVFTILAMVFVAKMETGIGAAVINLAMDTSIDLNHLDLLIYSMEPSN